MTDARRIPDLVILPRLLRPAAAASYLGVSESLLRTLPIPRRKIGDRVTVYLRDDLDSFAYSIADGDSGEDDGCDDLDKRFGL